MIGTMFFPWWNILVNHYWFMLIYPQGRELFNFISLQVLPEPSVG